METDKSILDNNCFIMLDVVNTINENETTKGFPIVQIVDSSNQYSVQSVEAIKSRIGSSLKLKQKIGDLFTITLNIDEEFKNQLFR